MALGGKHFKTEMKGTGGGRWCPRAEAKRVSRKLRRMRWKRKLARSADYGDVP